LWYRISLKIRESGCMGNEIASAGSRKED